MKRVESLGFYTRSAARATFSAYKSVPFRWRLAGGSAALTFVILTSFAALVGVVTNNQVRSQFNDEVRSAADQLQQQLGTLKFVGPTLNCNKSVKLNDYSRAESAQIRIYQSGVPYCTQTSVRIKGAKGAPYEPALFPLQPERSPGSMFTQSGYRVALRKILIEHEPAGMLLYARPISDVDHTLARVQFFLLLGVLGGTVLALLAGLATAQRAMRPIAELTEAAREIERTRDPSRHVPHPRADDEVAELARTLEGMLQSLDAARGETEAMLDRQREFVADASHELRTPLTSVLANLELLTEELAGEQAETAQAALRSTRRMRRLVGNLLLLARADANRVPTKTPTDLGEVLTEAAAELGPVAEGHELSLDAESVMVAGVRDDLHRLALNLIENALVHTPPGTHIHASTTAREGSALLVVEDNGPGIPTELERRVFERFVRGGRDGGRGSGLGLAIVAAVAESHGGAVTLQRPPGGGTRLAITLPLEQVAVAAGNGEAGSDHTSTTTGRTIGRRRSRS